MKGSIEDLWEITEIFSDKIICSSAEENIENIVEDFRDELAEWLNERRK